MRRLGSVPDGYRTRSAGHRLMFLPSHAGPPPVTRVRGVVRAGVVALLALPIVVLTATLAFAAEQRAELSEALRDRLAGGETGAIRVIVPVEGAQLDQLAQQYGFTIVKRLRNGAVVDILPETLNALSQEPDIAAITDDAPVTTT